MALKNEWLYDVSEWLICACSLVILLFCSEIGSHLGRRALAQRKHVAHPQIATLQTAILGLLALLIGFTFSMAENRFEMRKALVLEEANAIGTTALRARLLPEPHATDIHALLRSYIQVRLSFDRSSVDATSLDRAITDTVKVQQALWREATAVSALDPHSISTGLFVRALNDTIDLHEKRLTALRNHVPQVTFLLLYLVAFIGLGFTGYDCGLLEAHHRVPNGIMAVLIAGAILFIVDLDRPVHGMITVSEQPLIDLQTAFDSETASPG
ncbi:MAG: hypothetical protein ACLQJR_30070 [Stellaceae bacterium]